MLNTCDEGKFYSDIYTLKFQDRPNNHLPHPTTELNYTHCHEKNINLLLRIMKITQQTFTQFLITE